MTNTIKLLGIALVLAGLISCNKGDKKTATNDSENKKAATEEKKESGNNQNATGQQNKEEKTVTEKKEYTDLTEFWNDFRKYALAGDYEKISEMTKFPFLHQSNQLSKSEFKDFTFTDNFLEGMKTKKKPEKSEMMFNGIKSGEMYEVDYDGQGLYFAKVNGNWKFVGLLYGE